MCIRDRGGVPHKGLPPEGGQVGHFRNEGGGGFEARQGGVTEAGKAPVSYTHLSHLDYDSKGAIIGMNLEGLEYPFTWQYDPTSGFLNYLTYPNGMALSLIHIYVLFISFFPSMHSSFREPEHAGKQAGPERQAPTRLQG